MGKLTDNIRKVSSIDTTFNAGTLVQNTLLLDIPRGYVARILSIHMSLQNINEDLEQIGSGGFTFSYAGAVSTNTEDEQTSIPHSVDHSVLAQWHCDVIRTDNYLVITEPMKYYDFAAMGVDVITPRDLTINVDAFGSQLASATEARLRVEVSYKYEKVTDKDLLEILDIL